MVNLNLKAFNILLPLMLISTPLKATETLLSLYQAALNYDAQYKGVLANTQADKEEVEKARALFYPKVQLSGSVGRGNTDRTTQSISGAIDSHINYNTKNFALIVKQPLFNRETMATYKGAQALAKGKEFLLQSETLGLITRVAKAYVELLYAEDKSTVTYNQIRALKQQLEQARKRYEHGSGTITEISEAQASLDIAQADWVTAKNSVDANRVTLSTMTGYEIGELAKLNPDKIATLNLGVESLDDWLNRAVNNNPEVIAAQYAVEVAEQEVEKKQAGHYPTLDLVGARSYSENDSNNTIGAQFDTTTVALQFNLPLYAGGYVNASVRQSLERVKAAQEDLNLKTREINTNIKRYFQQMQSEQLSIQAYRQAVKSSELALDGISKSFTGGFRTNIDVLNAQQRLYENQLKLSQSYYVLVSDMVNIQHAAGQLNAAQLQELNQFFDVN